MSKEIGLPPQGTGKPPVEGNDSIGVVNKELPEVKFSVGATTENIFQLMGEILTIIDATYMNDKQNKAVKDLIKDKFYARVGMITDIAYTEAGYNMEELTTVDNDTVIETVEEKEFLSDMGVDPKHL